ncbi:MAG: hypothetical protein AB1585_04270 [Thermodesulfobacteriota bacterium]
MPPQILIVDNEPATLFGFNRYPTKAGFKLQEAVSLEIFSEFRFIH